MQTPKYKKAGIDDFFLDLKEEVLSTLGNYKGKSDTKMLAKGLFLFSFFLILMTLLYFSVTNILIYFSIIFIIGIIAVPLVLNIGHDAAHGVFSTNKKINNIAGMIFYVLGTSGYFWALRHNYSHHKFSNIKDWDMDIEQSKIIRLSPYQEIKKHHKYQHLYMPIAFSLYSLVWFFYRDFKDIFTYKFGLKEVTKHPSKEIIILIIAKIMHIVLFILLPYYLSGSWFLAIVGFFIFHISTSVVTTFALISTHVGEDQKIVLSENFKLPYTWSEHQLQTTADFSTNKKRMFHFFGGFNHHVAHHFFPNIPHIYYPIITPIIKKYAEQNNIEYNVYPSLYHSAISHFKRLKKLSR